MHPSRYLTATVFSLLIILSILISISRAEEEKHPIDMWMETSMDQTGGVTVDIRNVLSQAQEKWDQELNRVYKVLMSKLSAENKEILREAQRTWIKFRDSDSRLIGGILLTPDSGTLAPLVAGDWEVQLIRNRVLELTKYLNAIENPP